MAELSFPMLIMRLSFRSNFGEEAVPWESRKSTRQKACILRCLCSMEGAHPTADELVDRLKRSGTPVSKATVYRFLTELEEAGRVRRYRGPEGGPALIEYLGDPAEGEEDYHLLCETCGTMLHFDSEPLREAFHRFADENALAIDESKLVLYGKCPGCVKRNRG